MRAFHVTSTAPARTYYGRPGRQAFRLEDFEILTTILSALEWRRHNGPIKLYTDTIGAEYYAQLNLSTLWDAGIDTETLDQCDLKTSPTVFWAFARTVALGRERCPCVLLDTDLIVWRNITALIRTPFMAIHSEPLAFGVYVEKERLHTPPGYIWDDDWDWTAPPLNAALLYFGRDDLREYCVTKGLEFMRNNRLEEPGGPAHAVFVEQRLYPMCARKLGLDPTFFLQNYQGKRLADGTENTIFTHLWLYKTQLMHNRDERQSLCRRMAQRIVRDFPAFGDVLSTIVPVRPYLHS